MRKELGKWLMDIAKYLVTAVILSYFLNTINGIHRLIIFAFSIMFTLLLIGLLLIRSSDEKVNKKTSKRRK